MLQTLFRTNYALLIGLDWVSKMDPCPNLKVLSWSCLKSLGLGLGPETQVLTKKSYLHHCQVIYIL